MAGSRADGDLRPLWLARRVLRRDVGLIGLRRRLLAWSAWIYTRWWFAVLVFLLIVVMVVAANLVVANCQARGVPFYACGPGG